jgi:hypothetical protein
MKRNEGGAKCYSITIFYNCYSIANRYNIIAARKGMREGKSGQQQVLPSSFKEVSPNMKRACFVGSHPIILPSPHFFSLPNYRNILFLFHLSLISLSCKYTQTNTVKSTRMQQFFWDHL